MQNSGIYLIMDVPDMPRNRAYTIFFHVLYILYKANSVDRWKNFHPITLYILDSFPSIIILLHKTWFSYGTFVNRTIKGCARSARTSHITIHILRTNSELEPIDLLKTTAHRLSPLNAFLEALSTSVKSLSISSF